MSLKTLWNAALEHIFLLVFNIVFLILLCQQWGKKTSQKYTKACSKNAIQLHILLWKKMSARMVTLLSKTVEVEHTS
jgi:hypothetical protein